MARGRFISNAIITDRQVHELSSDTCRLAYTWLITLADREGRVIGEPDLLLAQLFPRRLGEITSDDVEGFIREWVNAGFVIWYEGKDGDYVLQLVNFEKHQTGLRKDRETPSNFDSPDDCLIIAGVKPDEIPFKLKVNVNVNDNDKVKDNSKGAKNDSDLFSQCQAIYEQKKGMPVTDGRSFALMVKNFEAQGATAEDYAAAIDAMDADERYRGSKPTSYEKWTIGYADKRKHPAKGKSGKEESFDFEKFTAEVFND